MPLKPKNAIVRQIWEPEATIRQINKTEPRRISLDNTTKTMTNSVFCRSLLLSYEPFNPHRPNIAL